MHNFSDLHPDTDIACLMVLVLQAWVVKMVEPCWQQSQLSSRRCTSHDQISIRVNKEDGPSVRLIQHCWCILSLRG
jgi:hypothetical protein